MGMVFKKFYCHKCGERLGRHPTTRTVSRGDADYKEYNRIGGRYHLIGDVEVTEYDFQCPACGKIIEYDEQCVVAKLQKQTGEKLISEQAISEIRDSVKAKMDRNAKICKLTVGAVFWIVFALLLYLKNK